MTLSIKNTAGALYFTLLCAHLTRDLFAIAKCLVVFIFNHLKIYGYIYKMIQFLEDTAPPPDLMSSSV